MSSSANLREFQCATWNGETWNQAGLALIGFHLEDGQLKAACASTHLTVCLTWCCILHVNVPVLFWILPVWVVKSLHLQGPCRIVMMKRHCRRKESLEDHTQENISFLTRAPSEPSKDENTLVDTVRTRFLLLYYHVAI